MLRRPSGSQTVRVAPSRSEAVKPSRELDMGAAGGSSNVCVRVAFSWLSGSCRKRRGRSQVHSNVVQHGSIRQSTVALQRADCAQGKGPGTVPSVECTELLVWSGATTHMRRVVCGRLRGFVLLATDRELLELLLRVEHHLLLQRARLCRLTHVTARLPHINARSHIKTNFETTRRRLQPQVGMRCCRAAARRRERCPRVFRRVVAGDCLAGLVAVTLLGLQREEHTHSPHERNAEERDPTDDA